ncbi:DUF2061 domain-containing protein [Sphingobium xenophagum]|uniref:DUF2061 domain-containing protein n=1 Tax=Sphingobium xenophagum TaxID=121428 RepID=A0A401J8L6_SPHXE|nr:DUF2061 domain-containing protein [Sphingobium xenophagum]GBH32963.1 hypothetical protein MBESOW_P4189 [Sphingobium xenophagum]
MPTDLIKTFTYLTIHLTVGFSVAYLMTGSVQIAGGIALVEPCVNAVAFFFHEKAWKKKLASDAARAPRHHGTGGALPA